MTDPSESRVIAAIPSISSAGADSLTSLCADLSSAGVEPYVVANGRALGEELNRKGLPHISLGYNAGFGAAVSHVASVVPSWEWLVIANDDIEIAPRQFAAALETGVLRAPAEVGMVYLIDQPERGIPGLFDIFLQVSMLSRVPMLRRGKPRAEGYGSFSCVAIRRETWIRLGGFDEAMRFTYEDADFARRAMDAGYHASWMRDAGTRHAHSKASAEHVADVLPVATASALAYADKWVRHRISNRILLFAALQIRMVLAPWSKAPLGAHWRGAVRSMSVVLRGARSELPAFEGV